MSETQRSEVKDIEQISGEIWEMDKKSFVTAVALSSISVAAIIPIYLLLKKNKELKRKLKEKDGSENEKSLSGKVSVENGSTSKRGS